MPDPGFHSVLLILISPAVGSFLGVVIDRMPRGESVVAPRSACRACGTRLGFADLVPVLSYAAARGRCRHCGAPVAPWHLYVELSAIGAAVLAVALGGGPAVVTLTALLFWVLLTLAVADLLWFRLPDALTGLLLALALTLALLRPVPALPGGPAPALAGAAVGVAAFWVVRLAYRYLRGREGLGLGDVKLMAGLGALTGPFLLPHLVLLAALGALAAALLDRARGQGAALHRHRALPFGTALCLAGAALWIFHRLPH